MRGRTKSVAWVLAVATAGLALAATPTHEEARREATLRFALDDAYLADGGAQYFYELVQKDAAPEKNATFKAFRPFDFNRRWEAKDEPLHVVMSRIVYEVDKDVSFFTRARTHDLQYINAVVPDAEVTRNKDGSFSTGKTPAHTFTVRYLDRQQVRAEAADGGVAALLAFTPGAGLPDSVVVQENTGFSRVMGVRTGAAAMTWTAHYPRGKGRTRLCIFSMSYMHNIPPFFLGGEDRVFKESIEGAAELIRNLRAYQPPDGG